MMRAFLWGGQGRSQGRYPVPRVTDATTDDKVNWSPQSNNAPVIPTCAEVLVKDGLIVSPFIARQAPGLHFDSSRSRCTHPLRQKTDARCHPELDTQSRHAR